MNLDGGWMLKFIFFIEESHEPLNLGKYSFAQ
jgi:hypothetical protein